MVSSVDGFVAAKDNSISWFETSDYYEKGIDLSDEERKDFLKTIDCYVMGARTYEHALELSKSYGWVYGDVPTIVLSHKNLAVDRENIEIYSGELDTLVRERLRQRYNSVWVVGGSVVAKEFLNLNLANEIRMTVIPIILGEGKLFFDHIGREILLHLKDATAYKNGMVELRYEIKKNADLATEYTD